MKKFFAIITLLILTLVSCAPIDEYDNTVDEQLLNKTNYPVIIEKLSFSEPPKEVISLSPVFTQIIIELGFKDSLIGVSDYCGVENMTQFGSPINPDISAIIEASPQLVVTQSPIALTDKTALESNGIAVIYKPAPRGVYEYLDIYAAFALLYTGNNNFTAQTAELLKDFDRAMLEAKDKNYNVSYLFVMTSDNFIATGDTLAGDLLTVFGENVAQDYTKYTIPSDEFANLSPEVIFLSSDINIENLPKTITDLKAFSEGKIIKVSSNYFEKPDKDLYKVLDEISARLENMLSL